MIWLYIFFLVEGNEDLGEANVVELEAPAVANNQNGEEQAGSLLYALNILEFHLPITRQ